LSSSVLSLTPELFRVGGKGKKAKGRKGKGTDR
jgi:hypothetical protein